MKRLLLIFIALVNMMYACAGAESTPATPTDLECAHIHYYPMGTNTDLDNAEYQEIADDDSCHLVIAKSKDLILCEDCNQTVVVNEYDSQDLWPHTYEDGVCIYCGHKNHCAHEFKYQTTDFYDYSTVTYTPIDNREHTVAGKGYSYWECETCRERLKAEDNIDISYPIIHEYENGVCVSCGHKNTCMHEHVVHDYYGESWNHTYTPIDNEFHETTFLARTYDLCLSCGEMFNINSAKLLTEKEKHRVRNNVCIECGQQIECDHSKNTSIYNYETKREYINHGDDRTHTVVETGLYRRVCNDCFANLGTEERVVRYEQNHGYWYPSNHCDDCGFDNECAHNKGTYTEYAEANDVMVVDHVDAETHTVIGGYSVNTKCNICDKIIDSYIDYDLNLTEVHQFENGICKICGYKNPCSHNNQRKEVIITDYSISQINKYSHTRSGGFITTKTICSDCGEVLKSIEDFNKQTEEEHTYQNGKCTVCGYLKPQEKTNNPTVNDTNNEQKCAILSPVTEYSEEIDQITKTLTDCVNTGDLSVILPENVCQELNGTRSLLMNPRIVGFENIPDDLETVTVIFKSDKEQKAGRDVVVLLGMIHDTEWKWYTYQGKTLEDNMISFTIPREELTVFGDNPIILSVFASE